MWNYRVMQRSKIKVIEFLITVFRITIRKLKIMVESRR